MGEGGFEPPKSLTADLQSVPFGHSGIPPYSLCCTHFETQRSGFKMKRRKAIADMELFASAESGMEQASFDGGAGRRIRTPRPADYKDAFVRLLRTFCSRFA